MIEMEEIEVMVMKKINLDNNREIDAESEQEEYDDLENIRKHLEERAKDGQKYFIFVVALPLIGALGLSLFGAMNYKYNFQFDTPTWVILITNQVHTTLDNIICR